MLDYRKQIITRRIIVTELTIRKPIDAHLHLRDGDMLKLVAPFSANRCSAAIVMPNLKPPVTTAAQAAMYKQRILAAVPNGSNFVPYMTAYLTDTISPEEIRRGFEANRPEERQWVAAKLYPAGATTNSEEGVTDIQNIYPVLRVLQEIGMPLLIHGEHLYQKDGKEVHIMERERRYLGELALILNKFPTLKVVLEHITTRDAVEFVLNAHKIERNIVATITPHHLYITTNDIFRDGIRPDLYCLPIAKREEDRLALRKATISGLPCFFAGTDSAPHDMKSKYSACGCAGIFNAHASIELYTQVFEEEGELARLNDFMSGFAGEFYEFPESEETITLVKRPWIVAKKYSTVVPFMAGCEIAWQVQGLQG